MEIDLEFDLDCICEECGEVYGEHYSDLEGDDWCPFETFKKFRSPFASLLPVNSRIN